MRIVYDGHIFRWQKAGGISRYFNEIISRLPVDWQPLMLGTEARNGNFPVHPRLEVSPLCSFRPRRFSQPFKKTWWKLRYIQNARVFHPTFYNLTGGLRFSEIPCPVVVTVHDFIKARYPQVEGDSTEAVAHQREAILHAAHVVCVSKATEQDLLEFHPQAAGKTSVIYHGSSFSVCHEPQPEEIFETPTFLYVGRRATYKNFSMVLRAFAKACASHPGIRLRIAGPPLDDEERWHIHFLGISDRVDSSVFPDEHSLQQLYRKSVALLYPSRHEGFGIPPLEAMACGTLVITSNATSLPEVVGDAGIILDPADENAWAECILQVAAQRIRRKELIEKGKARAAVLTWERSATRHVEIYKQFS
jgi:glycosyltransferase involved in cell wall biosynthesis